MLSSSPQIHRIFFIGGQKRQSSDIIYTNGTVIKGPKMPYNNFMWNCVTKLHNGTILFVGGFKNRKTTIFYEPSLESFSYGPDMIFARHDPGCTLFYSPMHNGRPVVIVTGKVIFYKSRGEHTYALSFYRSQNILGCSTFLVSK